VLVGAGVGDGSAVGATAAVGAGGDVGAGALVALGSAVGAIVATRELDEVGGELINDVHPLVNTTTSMATSPNRRRWMEMPCNYSLQCSMMFLERPRPNMRAVVGPGAGQSGGYSTTVFAEMQLSLLYQLHHFPITSEYFLNSLPLCLPQARWPTWRSPQRYEHTEAHTMDGNRRWFGWVAIGIGALALLAALGGRGLQVAAAGLNSSRAPQPFTQQDVGRQEAGPQRGADTPGTAARRGEARVEPQRGAAAPGMDARRGAGRQGGGGLGVGGWFSFPFRMIGGAFQMGLIALLVGLGVWLIRGCASGGASGGGRAETAQVPPPEPHTPTGESYTDEPRDRE
jgi:hypothetical protein